MHALDVLQVLDLNDLRKDIMTGMLHWELRHEVMLGGKAKVRESGENNVREGRKVSNNFLPTIML